MPERTNHLVSESSPYLLQHVHNPVDWYPWGEDALKKARELDKPIFLSIGYAACHWCHVMEKESFENPDVAAILNEHFISIKVDREERPDIDEIYMTAVQLLTGSGGWPLSVFLTPDLKPFYGGTYYPPEDRYGRPGFTTLLLRIAEVWEHQRDDINESADHVAAGIRQHAGGPQPGTEAITESLFTQATESIGKNFDRRFGGFGGAPKFPSSQAIMLMLRQAREKQDDHALHMATFTLDRMASGGLYDQLGGGFHRYSVDEKWLVPHFEKMLYDNAQLLQAYIEAWQATRNPLYERVVRETLAYIAECMTDESGAFYSTEDADSEGEEGRYYIWSHQQIADALDEEDARLLSAWYTIREHGNFPSHESYHANLNILHLSSSPAEFAKAHGMEEDAWLKRLEQMKQSLLAIRAQRVRPVLDDKVITGWNGLMISACARAYQAFGNEEYLRMATAAADFVLKDLRPDGQLLHTWRHGNAKLPAFLDDYSYMVQALVDLYEASLDIRYLDAAAELTEAMNERFWDDADGGWFYTADDHTNLIARTKPFYDGATPSGNSMAATALLRLALLLDNDDYRQKAESTLAMARNGIEQSPRGHVQMLLAAHFQLYPVHEIVIVGPRQAADTAALLQTVHRHFVPSKVLTHIDPDAENATALTARIPLLAHKAMIKGQPAAYVCRNFSCQAPVTQPEALTSQLVGGTAKGGAE